MCVYARVCVGIVKYLFVFVRKVKLIDSNSLLKDIASYEKLQNFGISCDTTWYSKLLVQLSIANLVVV